MSDVIVTDSDDGSPDIAAIETGLAMSTAENTAHAQHAAVDATDSAIVASTGADISEEAARTSVTAAGESAAAAESAGTSAQLALTSVAGLQSELATIRALLDERLTAPDPTPEPEPETPDTPPRREHWLRRKVGK